MREVHDNLQEMIYFFNEEWVRTVVIKHYLTQFEKKGQYIWKGTIYCQKIKKDIVCKNGRLFQDMFDHWGLDKIRHKKYLFTVAYIYKTNFVHHVSFIFDAYRRELLCFDPGYKLYLYGYYKIIPMTIDLFQKKKWLENKIILKTSCPQKYFNLNFGLQFNGDHPEKILLPADAFCQIWTIYFLITYIQYDNHDFFKDWCMILPHTREYFIISTFIIPVITMIPEFRMYSNMIPSFSKFINDHIWKKNF